MSKLSLRRRPRTRTKSGAAVPARRLVRDDTPAPIFGDLKIPSSVVSEVDVTRLVNEMERVDNEMTTITIQQRLHPRKRFDHPMLSDQLTDFLRANKVDISSSNVRSTLVKQLQKLKGTLPVIHMTFAVTADRESLEQLVDWLRRSVHPQLVVEVGLQPALVAGVYMRTPNHIHDYSLRALLKGHEDSLVAQLEGLRGRS